MKKAFLLLVVALVVACNGQKEVKLPIANATVVATVEDHSPIYFFFERQGNDTLVDLNRKNSISSTHWIFNIDRRLPLRLVVPELQKMQAKKEGSVHKNEASENYFSYMDDSKKTLAFLPFTKVTFRQEKPKDGILVYFSKGKIWVNDSLVAQEDVEIALSKKLTSQPKAIRFGFDQNQSFGDYLSTKVMMFQLQLPSLALASFHQDFVY